MKELRILNDEEILDLCGFSTDEALADLLPIDENSTQLTSCAKSSAKAQFREDIKGFIEWGLETCIEHPKSYCKTTQRRLCSECFLSLKQLVE